MQDGLPVGRRVKKKRLGSAEPGMRSAECGMRNHIMIDREIVRRGDAERGDYLIAEFACLPVGRDCGVRNLKR
jgi:hypothetical protein